MTASIWNPGGINNEQSVLETKLRDIADLLKGAGIVGFNDALDYPTNTVGDGIQLRAKLSALADSTGANMVGSKSSATGSQARTVQTRLDDFQLVTNFATLAIAVASGVAGLIFPPGAYSYSGNTTFPMPVRMMPGAVISGSTGILTFSNLFEAGVQKCFTLTGSATVTFNPAFTRSGYFEWWGVLTGDGSAPVASANAIAMNAALIAIAKVEMMPADYFISSFLKVETPNAQLVGHSQMYDSVYGTRSTRLIGTTNSMHVLQIGPDSNPGSIAQFPLGIVVKGLQVQRSVAPAVASGCVAVRMQYVLEAYVERVRGDESMHGWEFNGTVSCRLFNTSAKRTAAGTGGTDSWRGYYVNGNSGVAAGGNASLYISYSHADDTRSVKTNSQGFYADNKFTDCFLIHCETVACTIGMEVNGNNSATNDFGNTDMTIIHGVNDSFATYGIYIHNLGISGSVDVAQPYCGPASGATAAIGVYSNTGGAVTITGGQLVMGAAPGAIGVVVDGAEGVSVLGTIILENGSSGAVVLANARNCRIMPTVVNESTTGGPAVQLLNTCVANYIAPIAKGKASGVSLGIQAVGTGDSRNEYNCTGLDSDCVAGGSANKLTRNGVTITATGLSGTNLVSGVMT